MESLGVRINTAKIAESAEMTKKESLNRITESIISGCKVGLLMNFNVKVMKDGIRRMVNDFPDPLCSLRAQR
jgi:hypothetical protein